MINSMNKSCISWHTKPPQTDVSESKHYNNVSECLIFFKPMSFWHCIMQQTLWNERKTDERKGEKWGTGWGEERIIFQGFTPQKQLFPNTKYRKANASLWWEGLATSALQEKTTTKCCCWELNGAAVLIACLCKSDMKCCACSMMFDGKITIACCVWLEKAC